MGVVPVHKQCGVTKTHQGTEFICTKPKHVRLYLVMPGDKAQDFITGKKKPVPHKFEVRYPHR